MREIRPLHSGWSLTCLGGPGARPGLAETIPAQVPGTVHTDLLAAGLIPDPYLDLNEISVDWVGRCDWRYETRFDWQDEGEEHADLVFAGLDTFATIVLNGVEIGRTANMNRTYRFAVREHLRAGENHLAVSFESAWKRGEALAAQYEPRPNNYPGPANLMRKMACNFGWDWGPTLVTSGLWQAVALESWSGARLGAVRPEITLDGADGKVRLHAGIEGSADTALSLRVSVAGVTGTFPVSGASVSADLTVKSPELWWPHNLGGQKRYDLSVQLCAGETIIDSWSRDIGFRSLRLDTTPDAEGTPFVFVINDVPVYISGPTGSPTIASCPASRRSAMLRGSGRPRTPISTCCGSGAAAFTRPTSFTRPATGQACWSGRIFSSPAPPIPRRATCRPKSRPRRGTISFASCPMLA